MIQTMIPTITVAAETNPVEDTSGIEANAGAERASKKAEK